MIVPASSANDKPSTARTLPNRFVSDSATTTLVTRSPSLRTRRKSYASYDGDTALIIENVTIVDIGSV